MTRKDDIEEKISTLSDLSREQLIAAWQKTYGASPPTGVRRELLTRSLAWHLQEKRYGGLSGEARRLLKSAMRQTSRQLEAVEPVEQAGSSMDGGDAMEIAPAATAGVRNTVNPGARLIRDWNGKTHVVDVIETGFLFEGVRYRSLSGIARKITGATWSGPRFFGL